MGGGVTQLSQVNFFCGNQIFCIFNFLLHELALEVKDSKNVLHFADKLVHSDPEKSLTFTQKPKSLISLFFQDTYTNKFIILLWKNQCFEPSSFLYFKVDLKA